MRADLIDLLISLVITRSRPLGISGQIHRLPIVLKFFEINRHWSAWFHRIHQPEMIEGRSLFLKAFRQFHNELLAFPLFVFVPVTVDLESEASATRVSFLFIIERPP